VLVGLNDVCSELKCLEDGFFTFKYSSLERLMQRFGSVMVMANGRLIYISRICQLRLPSLGNPSA
jgi:hypothetical protein